MLVIFNYGWVKLIFNYLTNQINMLTVIKNFKKVKKLFLTISLSIVLAKKSIIISSHLKKFWVVQQQTLPKIKKT